MVSDICVRESIREIFTEMSWISEDKKDVNRIKRSIDDCFLSSYAGMGWGLFRDSGRKIC